MGSFSCGEIFYYWKEFKSYPNYNSYYSKRMIIKGKYRNLKEELLFNNDNEVNIKKFNTLIVLKSKQFMPTKTVRKMKYLSHQSWYNAYYGIKKGSSLKAEHIQALISYTDFSLLSTSFTKTFRKIHP